MLIKKKRIRNVERYLLEFAENSNIYVTLSNLPEHIDRLVEAGFTSDLEIGERVLPAIFGTVSRYNAEGKFNIRRDLPKETVYHQREWHWTDWAGDEHSKIVDVPRERYPRDFVEPPAKELTIVESAEGEKFLISDRLVCNSDNYGEIKHFINLFLEIFKECEVLREDLKQPIPPPAFIQLNWRVLPPGEYPWEALKPRVDAIAAKAKEGKRPIITARFETIAQGNVDFVAAGTGGFDGYVVFGFPDKDIFILESAYYGEATYVLDRNWEAVSQMTKAQILNANAHRERIIHREGWTHRIQQLIAG